MNLSNDDATEHFAYGKADLLLGAISMKSKQLTETEINEFKTQYEKVVGPFDEKNNQISLSDIAVLYKKVIAIGGFREAVAENFFKKSPT